MSYDVKKMAKGEAGKVIRQLQEEYERVIGKKFFIHLSHCGGDQWIIDTLEECIREKKEYVPWYVKENVDFDDVEL